MNALLPDVNDPAGPVCDLLLTRRKCLPSAAWPGASSASVDNPVVLECFNLFGVGVPDGVPTKSSVRFAGFVLDLSTGELSSNGNKTYLQEKPFQVLVLLLDIPETCNP